MLAGILFWSALGVLFALPALGQPGMFRPALGDALAQWWAWGLMAVGIAAVDSRLPFRPHQLIARLAAHVPLGLAATALHLYVSAALRAVLDVGPWSDIVSLRLLSMAVRGMGLWSLLVYWLIVGVLLAFRYHQRYLASEVLRERTERLSIEARLQALRYQLDPHFLFNALNTISAQVEADPRLARRMIEHLGDLFRATLGSHGRHETALAQELEILGHYLSIQSIRFGDRLRVTIDVPPPLMSSQVPTLVLQPLVENALRHGVSPRLAGGTIRIASRQEGGDLLLTVEDDGVGLPPDWPAVGPSGLGLSITRQRLEGLYGPRHDRLDVRPRDGGGTIVRVRLPLATVNENAHA